MHLIIPNRQHVSQVAVFCGNQQSRPTLLKPRPFLPYSSQVSLLSNLYINQ